MKPTKSTPMTRLFSTLVAAALVLGLAPTAVLANPAPSAEGKQVVSVTPIEGAPTAEETAAALAQHTGSGSTIINADGTLTTLPDQDYTSDESHRTLGPAAPAASRPDHFDLRDAEYHGQTGSFVTPIKFQNPFGSCWAFAAIAAAETSMQSENGKPATSPENTYDFSEKQVSWFTQTSHPDNDEGQMSEGFHNNIDIENRSGLVHNLGGDMQYATTLFSMMTGPLSESVDPVLEYHNAENDYDLFEGDFVQPSSSGDWSVPEVYRDMASAELEATFYLPSPASYEPIPDSELERYVTNWQGIDAIKDQLLAGRGVAIGYCADHTHPSAPEDATFINTETWSHYTYESPREGSERGRAGHAVCIVGYDDNYSADNFLADHRPPGDGAFIVKNSWGGLDGSYGNRNNWGVNGSGYFYLSYYDKSIEAVEAYDFITPYDDDLTYGTQDSEYTINYYQYNFLPGTPDSSYFDPITSMANVFEISEPSVVRTVSTQTRSFNTDVRFDVYRLREGATEPTDGTLVWSHDEHYTYGGFHREELETPLLVDEGDKLGIVVTVKLPDESYELINNAYQSAFSAEIRQPAVDKRTWGVAVVNPEESYYGSPMSRVEFDDSSYVYGDYEWNDLSTTFADMKATAQAKAEEIGLPTLLEKRNAAYAKLTSIEGDDPHFDEIYDAYEAAQLELAELVSEYEPFIWYLLNDVDNFPVTLTTEAYDPDNPPTAATVEMYRLYNPYSYEHLYTRDAHERDTLVAAGWNDEGVGWTAPARSNTAVYRLHNGVSGEHLYTSDAHERSVLAASGWNDEGIAFYSASDHVTAVYRLHNGANPPVAAHHYVQDAAERDHLIANGWHAEGIAWYAL